MSERTLAIIKPDAVAQGIIGDVIGRLSKEGLKVISIENGFADQGKSPRVLRGSL